MNNQEGVNQPTADEASELRIRELREKIQVAMAAQEAEGVEESEPQPSWWARHCITIVLILAVLRLAWHFARP